MADNFKITAKDLSGKRGIMNIGLVLLAFIFMLSGCGQQMKAQEPGIFLEKRSTPAPSLDRLTSILDEMKVCGNFSEVENGEDDERK